MVKEKKKERKRKEQKFQILANHLIFSDPKTIPKRRSQKKITEEKFLSRINSRPKEGDNSAGFVNRCRCGIRYTIGDFSAHQKR